MGRIGLLGCRKGERRVLSIRNLDACQVGCRSRYTRSGAGALEAYSRSRRRKRRGGGGMQRFALALVYLVLAALAILPRARGAGLVASAPGPGYTWRVMRRARRPFRLAPVLLAVALLLPAGLP